MFSTEKIKIWLKEKLKEDRYQHVLGAAEIARDLAQRFGINQEKAEIAALAHDAAKCISAEELLNIINENNIQISEMEKSSKKTLHAPVSAYFAKEEFDIDDKEILDAIRWHTLGRVNMTTLDKIVFLADKIEPYTRDKDFREKVYRKLDETNNLDEAVLLCYDATIRSLLDRRMIIAPQTIEVWNNLLSCLSK